MMREVVDGIMGEKGVVARDLDAQKRCTSSIAQEIA